jgi:carboxyl-terminal processing protease
MPRRFPKVALLGVLLVPALAGGFIAQERSRTEGVELFRQVVGLVSERFVDTVSQAELYEKAARGLLEELNDPYTELLTPKDRTAFETRTGGRYGGVGMQIEPLAGFVSVSRVFPNTPAEAAGIREGDRIIAVDTASTRDWKIDQVSAALLGTPGTKVTATFARPGVATPIVVKFTRATIKVPAVPYAITIDSIGYVPLLQFNEFATEEIEEAVRRFQRQGAKGVVLDLRRNPGGILEQALSVSDLFLKKNQEIASVRGRGFDAQTFAATGRSIAPNMPLVVLTDGGSASASEIVAGALQDHDRALIVGTTSYGKGLVQTLYNLDGGYAVKMTTAKYYLPSGRLIQKDRKPGENGALIEIVPDSLESDSVKKTRPAFKSDAGRVVYGGGGITPDVIIKPDTITTPEQEFYKKIAPKYTEYYTALSDYALQLKSSVRPGFTVQAAWRDELFRRITAAGVPIERELYDRATPSVDRELRGRVAHLAFGDSTAKRMSLEDDVQLMKALELLRGVRTQQDLFASARLAERKD